MKSSYHRIAITLAIATVVAIAYFLIANAYKTKIDAEHLDSRIDSREAILKIEELTNAKNVSAFRNAPSFFRSDKIDRIKLKTMVNQDDEKDVVVRAIGHIWMTGADHADLVMVRLMNSGRVKVTRLYTSICPPIQANTDNKKPNKSEMATPRKPSD